MERLIVSFSGIRGIYGTSLTEKHAFDFGMAFGLWVDKKNIIVGRDTRKNGKNLCENFINGLRKTSRNIYDAGIVPTPALTWFVEKHTDFCGAVITASHNPIEYNGIKLISSSGTFLNEKEFKEFFNIYQNLHKKKFRFKEKGDYFKIEDLMNEYFKNIIECVDINSIRKKSFRVVVDPVQGAGALYSRRFLEMLGCQVLMINEIPYGEFSHPPEPIPENLGMLSNSVLKFSACVGFAQDPDCDRLALVAEDGSFISEEQGLALLIKWILKREKGPVVVNIATTRIIDEICKKAGVLLFRTKVGEMFVVEKMKKVGAVAGGEGNGGIVLPKFHYGRDSFAGMALTLEMMAKTGKKMSAMAESLPKYFFIKKKISFPKSQIKKLYRFVEKKFPATKVCYLDGLRIDFQDAWLGIRPSGTEPVVRIFVEGKNKKKVQSILTIIEEYIISGDKNF